MGKLDIGLRTGNTIATPLRRGGELGNATANIPRQGISGIKNIAEVSKQTRDALVDNFQNFSKVEGKWYQRMLKVPANLVSAVTRRPAMIAGAGIASGLNQGVLQPFKKLLIDTPSKLFKGIKNATRIFSKKQGFDFQSYDTHETKGDTRVNQIKEKSFGFLGAKSGSSEKKVEDKKEDKKEEKKEEAPINKTPVNKPTENKKPEENNKSEDKKPTPIPEAPAPKPAPVESKKEDISSDKKKDQTPSKPTSPKIDEPKSIDEPKEKNNKEIVEKDKTEADAKLWKNLDKESKTEYEKDMKKLLNNKITKEGVFERAKKNRKGRTMEEILATLKKENPTMASYIEDEILSKQTPAKQVA